jgi:hypothetical protein
MLEGGKREILMCGKYYFQVIPQNADQLLMPNFHVNLLKHGN